MVGTIYLGQAGEIHESEVQNVGRVYLQVYWLSVDALVGARDTRRLVLYFPLYVAEVRVLAVRDVVELGPFRSTSSVL